jgi:hypothetical protein
MRIQIRAQLMLGFHDSARARAFAAALVESSVSDMNKDTYPGPPEGAFKAALTGAPVTMCL